MVDLYGLLRGVSARIRVDGGSQGDFVFGDVPFPALCWKLAANCRTIKVVHMT
jgi:hypothetical protein